MAASSIGDKVPRPGNAGKPDPNGSSVLTREDILEQARGVLLLTLDGSRHPRQMFEANWRRLWQLIGEADAAGGRRGVKDLTSATRGARGLQSAIARLSKLSTHQGNLLLSNEPVLDLLENSTDVN